MSAMKYWLWLSAAARTAPAVKTELLGIYESPENIFNAPPGELAKKCGREADELSELEKRDLSAANEIYARCKKQGIDIITMQDARYPARMRDIYSPPVVLYVKGSMPVIDDECAVTVIGTRDSSTYGRNMARKLGYELASCGGLLVSGLTRGAEAEAAKAALLAGGTVVGVLGTSHEMAKGKLFDKVAGQGALISEYPPGTEPYRSFFRARNRITSALSLGVCVVEAPAKSGTRLFVNDAVEQGKDLYAVPGNADSENSYGSNLLLKEGAQPVTCGWELLSVYAPVFPDKIREVDCDFSPEMMSDVDKGEKAVKKKSEPESKKIIDKAETGGYIVMQKLPSGLSDTQKQIISLMTEPEMLVDDIIKESGLGTAKVLSDLTVMQLKGYVRQDSGKRFTLKLKIK